MSYASARWILYLLVVVGLDLSSAQFGCAATKEVLAFYFPFYQAEDPDGFWTKWNATQCDASNDPAGNCNPHDPVVGDIASPFWPLLGPYSSSKTKTYLYDGQSKTSIQWHLKWMNDAGVDVVVISWWGQGHLTDRLVTHIKNNLPAGMKFCIMRDNMDVSTSVFDSDVKYIMSNYAGSTSTKYWRITVGTQNRPVILHYGNQGYRKLCDPDDPTDKANDTAWASTYDTLRAYYRNLSQVPPLFVSNANPEYRAIWGDCSNKDVAARKITARHADGVFLWGTEHQRTDLYADWMRTVKSKTTTDGGNTPIAIPTVSPGFNNIEHVNPCMKKGGTSLWNYVPRSRDGYVSRWRDARNSGADLISITSFNVWVEGSQIEPAIPHIDPVDPLITTKCDNNGDPIDYYPAYTGDGDGTYDRYSGNAGGDPFMYINTTKTQATRFKTTRRIS